MSHSGFIADDCQPGMSQASDTIRGRSLRVRTPAHSPTAWKVAAFIPVMPRFRARCRGIRNPVAHPKYRNNLPNHGVQVVGLRGDCVVIVLTNQPLNLSWWVEWPTARSYGLWPNVDPAPFLSGRLFRMSCSVGSTGETESILGWDRASRWPSESQDETVHQGKATAQPGWRVRSLVDCA